MGCPTNAKQSMLVTTIPAALDRGATPGHARARASASVTDGRSRRCTAMRARMDADGLAPRRAASRCARALRRRRPARSARRRLLLRSAVPDPHGLRRQAHVPASDRGLGGADARAAVDGFARRAADDLLGSLPRHAAARRADRLQARGAAAASDAAATTLPGYGEQHARWMRELRAHAGADRAAARRLPSGQHRRHGACCATTARRCSTIR